MTSSKDVENPVTDKEYDPWAIDWEDNGDYKKWGDMTTKEKVKYVFVHIGKIILVLACLYIFICSLSIMGSAFKILAGKTAGTIFGQSDILRNPVCGLIIGVLVTVLVQSSSTSTSITVTMVGANIVSVHQAIPIIMGANIGTSVTNTIVSLFQSMDVVQFRKAFAGATVHDIFNLLCVLILLPIEIITGFLEALSKAIIDSAFSSYDKAGEKPPDILKVITNPLTKIIIQVNKNAIKEIAVSNDTDITDELSMIKHGKDHLFNDTTLSDNAVGAILLVASLVVLCSCLMLMVRTLHSMMVGSIARTIKRVINADFPSPFGWLAGYLAILVGCGMTIVVQSSSVFTSTMTPLVGVGVISLKRMYPLTLGSNIGTTTTGILAALASSDLKNTLQIAFCHFFFNITGILIWYPVPFMRSVPIRGAKFLGNTTAKYRWFAVAYLIVVFFIVPLVVFGLSIAHIWAMGGVLIFFGAIVLSITVISLLQKYKPNWLPSTLRSWKWLPLFLRSLEPYDRVITKIFVCKCCTCCKKEEEPVVEKLNGTDNPAMELDNI